VCFVCVLREIERKEAREGSKGLKIQSILEGLIASSQVMNSRMIVILIEAFITPLMEFVRKARDLEI